MTGIRQRELNMQTITPKTEGLIIYETVISDMQEIVTMDLSEIEWRIIHWAKNDD